MADNKFTCRLCGHNKYDFVRVKGPYDGPPIKFNDPSLIDHYECGKCSVRFSSVEKFSTTKVDTTKK